MTVKGAISPYTGCAPCSAKGDDDQAPRWIHAPRAVRRPFLTDPPA